MCPWAHARRMKTISSTTRGALKLPEAAQYLGGISKHSVRRLIKRGLIKPNKALRHILIPIAELDRFLSK
jgi:excisionase family DNA binding protein